MSSIRRNPRRRRNSGQVSAIKRQHEFIARMLQLLTLVLALYAVLGAWLLWRHLRKRQLIRSGYVNAHELLRRLRISRHDFAETARLKGVYVRIKTFNGEAYIHPDDAQTITSAVEVVHAADKDELASFIQGLASNSLAGLVSGLAVAAIAVSEAQPKPEAKAAEPEPAKTTTPPAPEPAPVSTLYFRFGCDLEEAEDRVLQADEDRIQVENFDEWFYETGRLPPIVYKTAFAATIAHYERISDRYGFGRHSRGPGKYRRGYAFSYEHRRFYPQVRRALAILNRLLAGRPTSKTSLLHMLRTFQSLQQQEDRSGPGGRRPSSR